jgi:hypothetical protein
MNTFDWQQYIANYSDLSHLKSKDSAIRHYNHFGQFENRTDHKNKEKMLITIITPCIRPEKLQLIKESIQFEHICEWVIVYDLKYFLNKNLNFEQNKLFDDPKISEYYHTSDGISGNPQRNFALSVIKNKESYIYYLDDDNIINPNLYTLNLIPNKIYTFNQIYNGKLRFKGSCIQLGHIDSAMGLFYYPLVKDISWILDKYDADGYYFEECYLKNKKNWIYIDKNLCYYNELETIH